MKFLVYGAGVIGSVYAAGLEAASHQVSILARCDRLEELRELGVVIENEATGGRLVLPVLAVVGFTGGTGLPGFPGIVSPIWMAVAFAGLALHGTFSMADERS